MPVAGFACRDFRRCQRDLRRGNASIRRDVQPVILVVGCLDHKLADGRVNHLRVPDLQLVYVISVRHRVLRDQAGDARVHDPRVADVRVIDQAVRDCRGPQFRVDGVNGPRADLVRVDGPGRDLRRRHRSRVQLLRGHRVRRDLHRRHGARQDLVSRYSLRGDLLRGHRTGEDLVSRHRCRRDLLRCDRVRHNLVRRHRVRGNQLRHDAFTGDQVSRQAVRLDLPRRDGSRHDGGTADAVLRQHAARHAPALQAVPGHRGLFLVRAEFGALVLLQHRVPAVAGHSDQLTDPQRSVRNLHPVPRRRVLQRRVLCVLHRIGHEHPVQVQVDLRLVALVNGEPVVRHAPHAGVNVVLRQRGLRAVAVLHRVADLQLRVQHFRPDERDRPRRVNVFLRQQQRRAVFRLRDGIDPRHDAADVAVPLYALHVRAVADRVLRRRRALRQYEHVQVVPDHPPARQAQQAALRVQDGRLRVLPAPVRVHRHVRDVRVQVPRVGLLHRALDEHDRRRRVHACHVAVAQDRPSQLVTDVLRRDPDGLVVLFLPDLRDREALLRDRPSRHGALLRFARRHDVRDFDVPQLAVQRSGLDVCVVEVRRLHHDVALVERRRDLPWLSGRPRNLCPPAVVARRREYLRAACVPVVAPVILSAVGHSVPHGILRLPRSASAVPRLVRHRPDRRDLAVYL